MAAPRDRPALSDTFPARQQNTTYNPRFFDGNIYVTQIGDANFIRCFGYYDGGTLAFLGGAYSCHQ